MRGAVGTGCALALGLRFFLDNYSYNPLLVEVVILLGIMFLALLAIARLPILVKEIHCNRDNGSRWTVNCRDLWRILDACAA